MNFFSAHYEKVILLSFLILFVVLLLLQVNFMQNVQNQKVNAIMQKVEPPTDQKIVDYSKPEFKIDNVFSSTALWNSANHGAGARTELLSCFPLSVCPFCNDLILSEYFPTTPSHPRRDCPICGQELKMKEKRREITAAADPDGQKPEQADKNNNSVPDEWEHRYKLYSSSADDIDRDHDNDNFTTWEEYKLNTDPRNPKSHPAYIDCISFVRLNVNVFVNLRFRGINSHDGNDVKKWTIKMEHQHVNDRRRRLSVDFKIGSRFRHGRDTFVITNCVPDDVDRPGSGTYVTIRRVGTKQDIRCDYLKPVYDPIQFVSFQNTHPRQVFNCKIGGTFTLGNSSQGMNRYKVVSSTQSSAVVENVATRKKYTITSVPKLRPVESRSGSAAAADMTSQPSGGDFEPLQLNNRRSDRSVRRRRGTRR